MKVHEWITIFLLVSTLLLARFFPFSATSSILPVFHLLVYAASRTIGPMVKMNKSKNNFCQHTSGQEVIRIQLTEDPSLLKHLIYSSDAGYEPSQLKASAVVDYVLVPYSIEPYGMAHTTYLCSIGVPQKRVQGQNKITVAKQNNCQSYLS